MRIYTNTFDVSRPSPHRFWVPPYSDFKIGIKLVNAGVELENDFTVAAGTTELEPEETKIDGFTIYKLNSTDTGFVEYTIDVDGLLQKFKLVQIITDSTVFDVGGEGGDVPADVATKTWVNSQISDFITEDALTGYATKEELTGYAETSDIKDSTITFTQGGVTKGSFTLNQATSATIALDAGGGDMSNYYTKSETNGLLSAKADFTKELPADLTSWITYGWTQLSNDGEDDHEVPFTELTSGFYDISPYCDYTVSAQYVFDWSGYYYTSHMFSYCTNGKTVFCHRDGGEYTMEGTDYEGNISGEISVYFEVDTTKIPDGSGLYGHEDAIDVDSAKWFAYVSENMDGQAPYTLQELSVFGESGDPIRYGENEFWHNADAEVTPGFVEVSAVYSNEISGIVTQQGLTSYVDEQFENVIYPALDQKVSHTSYDGTTGTPPEIYYMTTVYETDWADISADADENTFYVVLPDPA